ncbi:glycosyl hydrolase family 85-domain-containing protein [Bipolaris maydis]|nr:glycosyl hydrolase family 85-domain-containing protein [Bipolaris maydis]KAJ6193850.1 glycosyl hydrolase family 85-domain-containing protein [Bipolaris maydis]KAJ6212021.1 glycosyl hydrolase family 85-domain-containing protein [Bipolaris maydis]
MAYLLGWKDILRPIRDGYRHLFPAPDTGPTPEERRKQRDLDRLKGFAYFDTFDQLEAWTEDDCDSFQRANTPRIRTEDTSANDDLDKADVLLIHDYSGNYHDYESVQATGIDMELYSCEYLQFVDVFIYFSHKLVCVPPPTWTNTLHRNGVEVLGTLLVEPQTEGSERLLQHTRDGQNMDFPLAKTLARIAVHYGFDGWLVNIEKRFPNDVWDPKVLEAFLCQLRAEMSGTMRLIWYDALTVSNKISYQNALSMSNINFASACGSILTNYCWKDADAENSLQLALSSKISPRNIFFGIDVWAQNKSSFTHPRVTYPEYGGGGTNTGVAVAKLAGLGLSAGIFAPAWSFEHFPGKGRAAERTVWQGIPLPCDMDCSCGDCLSRHQPNEAFAILKNAKERVAGSEKFFYTDFTRAFATHDDTSNDLFDGCSAHAQLGSQSILPRPTIFGDGHQAVELWHRLDSSSGTSCLVIEARQNQLESDHTTEFWLPLFRFDMPADASLQTEIFSDNASLPTGHSTVNFYIRTTDSVHFATIARGKGIQRTVCSPESLVPGTRIQELGRLARLSHELPRVCHQLHPSAFVFTVSQARRLHASTFTMSPSKRIHETETSSPKSKRSKVEIPAYHLAQSRQDESGEIVWPARREQIERARTIIKECAIAQKPTVIIPDKDADGLSSGAILYHTLTTLGLSSDLISVYFPPKGSNVHDESTKEVLTAKSPVFIFVLDQGSRKSPPLIDSLHTCLVIDHHFADEGGFPEGAEYVTAHDCPPVATSALLTYNVCLPLHADLNDKISWLAALGTHGDLGGTIKWEPPFPDMKATFKQYTKKAINDAVALVNAPRRSAAYNVEDAWAAVLSAESPGSIVKDEKLRNASLEVRRETERCTHTPPTFSADATIALLSISSAAQIHPVIATRWSGTLKSNKLEIVMCANEGYLPDRVNFSCRVAKCARAREGEEKIDIIKKLEGIVAGDKDLRARLGESFARGHKEASGGIVGKQEWEEFKKLMGVGERTKKTESATRKKKPTQKNTLANYFGKSAKA